MKKEDLKELIQKLPRNIFHSEADFQHTLAWEIRKNFENSKVRLERPFKIGNKIFYLDIFLEIDGEKIGIELKYKTTYLNKNIAGEEYFLKKQGAQDFGRYDFCKDVFRIEKLIEEKHIDRGFTIFLTNDKSYLNGNGQSETIDSQFRLSPQAILKGELDWNENRSWLKRRDKLNLRGEYPLLWDDFNKEHNFKILVLEINK